MSSLPNDFTEEMKRLLGEEYEAFLASYRETPRAGLRLNTRRETAEDFPEKLPFSLSRVPWIFNGYYYGEGDSPAKHPYYYAGLYYLQEPSAMTPASLLPVEPGDRVLDLCAAPGGKATELGAKLQGQGCLFANDISNSRAKALLSHGALHAGYHVYSSQGLFLSRIIEFIFTRRVTEVTIFSHEFSFCPELSNLRIGFVTRKVTEYHGWFLSRDLSFGPTDQREVICELIYFHAECRGWSRRVEL